MKRMAARARAGMKGRSMRDHIEDVKNPALRRYLEGYASREADFLDRVAEFGLEFEEPAGVEERAQVEGGASALSPAERYRCGTCPGMRFCADPQAGGIHVENDGKSFWRSWISPACLTCRNGVGTATFLISTQCPRDCWFCFNPNQVDCERLKHETNDVTAELESHHAQGARYVDLALTGGEPLLHKDEVMRFYTRARELYPDAYTRLYTSGSFLDEEMLRRLQSVGLDEIRFSIKTDDTPAQQDVTFERIAMARRFIGHVMVEMPVMPDGVEAMKPLLRRLDALGVQGINLLELCFPLHNAAEFARRGYKLKRPPMRVLYDYWYAGGLPIAGSEQACLELLEFAAQEDLGLGVHYCSLENKYTGQIYLQSMAFRDDGVRAVSPSDHFIKSAKAFGTDAIKVRALLAGKGVAVEDSPDGDHVEFPVAAVPLLRALVPHMEIAIGFYVAEYDESGTGFLKELDVRVTSPSRFDLKRDF